jgi:TRAP-type C4-dicarboxylate transport system substrate-binding protein
MKFTTLTARVRSTLVALTATAAMAAAAPSHAAEKWNLYVYNAVSTVAAVKGLTRVTEEIEKETGGALSVRLHLGGSLPINTTTITPAVSDDVVQMGDDGYFLGNVPVGGVLRLPMLIQTLDEYHKAAAIMEPYLQKAFERKGVIVLGQYLYPYQVAYSSKKLTSLADVKGQKIRVTSPEQSEFVRRLGGVPVTIGAPEVPSALDRSVVDGVLTANTGGGNVWKDLLKYNYRIGINYFNSVIIVNKDRFTKLSPDAQAKVRKIVRDNMPLITAAMEAEEEVLTRKFADGGMTITKASRADMELGMKTMAPYWDEWAKSKGPDAVEALKKVRAALGR